MSDIKDVQDDLAYMRALVSGGARLQAGIGECFMWAGLIYGVQCLGHLAQLLGWLPQLPLLSLTIGLAPTIVFLGVLGWILWRDRDYKPTGAGARALNGVFQGAGMANGVMAIVFAFGSYKAHSALIWFYHPIVVCMFQGVAWFVAYNVTKHAWLGWVSAGWFVATLALGFSVGDSLPYLLTITAALFLLMALPGYVISRGAKQTG